MSDAVESQRMSRVQAERLIASAYRIPPAGTDDASLPVNSELKLRTLTRLPSRGLAPLPTSSNEFYLQQSGVQFYMDDLVRQLQDKRPDQPALFIANYFSTVTKGTNVIGRPFEYANGCLQNRAAFLAQLQRSYTKIDPNTVLSVGDFTEMLWCQCRDLPTQLVRQATCHLPESEGGQRRASLRTLLASFSACFFFNEFLNKTYDIYNDISSSKDMMSNSPRSSSRLESIANAVATDRVIARLRVVAQQNTFNIPPMTEIEQIVVKSSSFKEFCCLFYESTVLIGYILKVQLAFQKLAS
ncbi:hypothetical protein V7S43_013579 [Phytophthora oleae]|uniref:Centriolar satellite-associated tubulin polyglutamylase complex regulator 1 n=1 Tax=Phytophthora oleae TaxID=2107226 RepID=A0ABD3F6Q8_9STRA